MVGIKRRQCKMKTRKKTIAVIMALMLLISLSPVNPYAADEKIENLALVFTDMPDNWSTAALENAIANGLLTGSGGKIMPEDKLTRAQMATVITKAFGADIKGDLKAFTDVKATDWYYGSMAKAYQMEVIEGSNCKLSPNSPITRQEVFAIIARAFKLQPSITINKNFSDIDDISDWARDEVFAIANGGYIQGAGGKLNPKGLITRAEFAQLFDNMIKQYIQREEIITRVADGNIIVNSPGVTLKDLTVNGDLIIGDGVGEGEFTLDNVDVKGRLVVRGGGTNSIIIRGNSNVSNIIISRVDGIVSVKVEGDAIVDVIYVDDDFDDVNIRGTIGSVEVNASDIEVTASNAQINTINILSQASRIVIDTGSRVGTLNVNENAVNAKVEVQGTVSTITTRAADTGITGSGSVNKVEAKEGATGASIETAGTRIEVDEGVAGVVGGGGTPIPSGSSTINNATGDGTTKETTTKRKVIVESPESDFDFDNDLGTIIEYLGNGGAVVIPAKIDGVDVVTIGDMAFWSNDSVTSIRIPAGVTAIGTGAFAGCENLEALVISGNLTEIADNIFNGCTNLKNITIPGSVSSIGEEAFSGCKSLTGISIPAGVTSIGDWAFSGCTALQYINVDVANTVYSSDGGVLFNKDKTTLISHPEGKAGTSFNIPDSVTVIGNGAFYNCINLENIIIHGDVVSLGDWAFDSCRSLKSLIIPDSVTAIGEGAFYFCADLESITLSDNITDIKNYTFSGCESLTSIAIPEKVDTIDDYAFGGCTSLLSIGVNPLNNVYTSDEGILYNKSKSMLMIYPAGKSSPSFIIPASVTEIGVLAFSGCSALKSITIPISVTAIGSQAFIECTGLESVEIPDSVSSIGTSTFAYCENLKDVSISNSITGLPQQVFYDCANLETVTFRETSKITSIGYSAFSNCEKLASIAVPNSVTYIHENAFSECSALTGITLSNTLKEIYSGAFSKCTGLTSITIPDSVTDIYGGAFWGCTGINSVTIGANVVIVNGLLSGEDDGFKQAYDNGGKAAGTYTLEDGSWIKQ